MKNLEIITDYYQQGDDFDAFLSMHNGDVVAAVKNWGQHLEEIGKELQKLSQTLEAPEYNGISGHGDTYLAVIEGLTDEQIDEVYRQHDLVLFIDEWEDEETEEDFWSEMERKYIK